VFLYGFDLLAIDGEDLRRQPWEIRRATLTRLLLKARPGVRLSEHLDGDGETIFRHACALGAEGIVAKCRDRPYRSGRCADWVKVKNPAAPAATREINH
jgi:bifunctional non-homologous end joining protein LigD